MKKLLFSRRGSAPTAPAVGSYEGQELFSVLNLTPTVVNSTAEKYNIDSSNVTGYKYGTNDLMPYLNYFNPLTYGIKYTASNTSNNKATFTLPIVPKKGYTLGIGAGPFPHKLSFCEDKFKFSSMIRFVRVTNKGSNGQVTFKIEVRGANGNFSSKGASKSQVTASRNQYSGSFDNTQKAETITIDLKSAIVPEAIIVFRQSGYTYTESKLEVSLDGVNWIWIYDSDNDGDWYTSSTTISGVLCNYMELYGPNSVVNNIFHKFRGSTYDSCKIFKSYAQTSGCISYPTQVGDIGAKKHKLIYPSYTSSYTYCAAAPQTFSYTKVDGTTVSWTASGDYNVVTLAFDGNVRPQTGLPEYCNLFAYEGDEWFDFPVQEWRTGSNIWVCEATYGSDNKISSVGAVQNLYSMSPDIIRKVQGDLIRAGIDSGSAVRGLNISENWEDQLPYRTFDLTKSSEIYNSTNYIKYTSTYPTFSSSAIASGARTYKSHMQEMVNLAEDLRGGAPCSSGCTGNCYNTCSELCTSTCQDVCTNTCINSCGTTCTTTCGSTCVSGCTTTCSTNCYTTCSGQCQSCTGNCSSACTTACYSGCSNACYSGCGHSCSTAGSCSGNCYNSSSSCSCGGGCTGACAGSCSNNCSTGCGGTCSGGCGSCGGNCFTRCAGNSGGCCGWGCAGSCGNGACSSGCYGNCKNSGGGSCSCGNGCSGGCATGCSSWCGNGCSSNCYGGCSNLCFNSCNATCTSNCSGGCNSACTSTCSNVCSATCQSACTSTCVISSCSSTCINGCTATCGNSCSGGCSTGCSYSCRTTCADDCGGNCNVGCINACTTYCSAGCSGSSSNSPVYGK